MKRSESTFERLFSDKGVQIVRVFGTVHKWYHFIRNLRGFWISSMGGVQIVRVFECILECRGFGRKNTILEISSKGAYKLSGRGGKFYFRPRIWKYESL